MTNSYSEKPQNQERWNSPGQIFPEVSTELSEVDANGRGRSAAPGEPGAHEGNSANSGCQVVTLQKWGQES